ncbi:MAG: hypothetical protein KAV87_23315 [Desulfobacteraceae bacterium]|nr:hypothetical protein [Desulfobacteraceae bacterium]
MLSTQQSADPARWQVAFLPVIFKDPVKALCRIFGVSYAAKTIPVIQYNVELPQNIHHIRLTLQKVINLLEQ